jgi:cardiolipin synthase A/B
MKADFVAGNSLLLLESGTEYFPALLDAIATATNEIHLESYIFADDETGRTVAAALGRAVKRGVTVRVLVDGFGANGFAQGLGSALAADGAEVLIFRPEAKRLSFRRHRLRRLHRKLVVIDGKVAFVGGINVIDDMDTPHQVPPRLDYAVRVTGPLLPAIHRAVHKLWALVRWASFHHREWPLPRLPEPPATGAVEAAFVVRDNVRHRRDIEEAYLEAIAQSRHEVILAAAYFLPGIRFRHALTEAAQRGVRVVIILQGRVEYFLLRYATRALYGSLIAAGVEIVEYHRSFLHAKVAVIDRTWATVGSSNIDPFSLLLAREANLIVRDRGFAEQLRSCLVRAIEQGSETIGTDQLRHRRLHIRIANWLAYGLVRLAIGLAGYGSKQYRA